jgi:multiple sugar transport system substrate-binding protein
VQSNGSDWVDGESGLIVLDNPEAMDAMQRIADLRFAHGVAPQSQALQALGMGGAQLLETKKVALIVDGSWALSWLWEIEGGVGTGVLPKMTRPGTDMQAHIVTIVRDTEDVDAAWEVIRFMSSPWYQERYCRIGVWLPSQTALMNETSIADWCSSPQHPTGYDLIVTDYTPNYGHYLTMPVGYVKAAETALQPVFDQIFNGEVLAADVLPVAVAEANQIMETEQQRPTE